MNRRRFNRRASDRARPSTLALFAFALIVAISAAAVVAAVVAR